MKMLFRSSALALMVLGALTPVSSIAAPKKPVAKTAVNWATTVAATPDGGVRMGNPAARVKVIEYGSLTCSHCAHFDSDAKKPLAGYIATGKVSYEFRNTVRDPVDAVAALLSHCLPRARYFAANSQLFATQQSWLFDHADDLEKWNPKGLSKPQMAKSIAAMTGLDKAFVKLGLGPKAQAQCMSSEAGWASLNRVHEGGYKQFQVEGTPTFIINGSKAEAWDWATLEPLIKSAGG